MKSIRIQFRRRLFVVVIFLLSLGLSTSYAQIGNLGIYGSVPTAYRANTRYVRVEPNDTDDAIGYTIPVNGLKNFNFYYLSSGMGFLPGEHYTVSYLDSTQTTMYGYEIVNYTPNSGHTNGTQVATAFNSSPSTPRGLHGRIYGTIAGVNYLFPNAKVVTVPHLQTTSVEVRTNDNGNFYAYYQNGNARAFLPISTVYGYERYDLIVSGTLGGCSFSQYINLDAIWEPYNAIDSSLSTYFVDWAETDVGDIVVSNNGCGD